MAVQSVIGGNLDSIEASAKRLGESAGKALETHADTNTAAEALERAIEEAMDALIARFNTIGQELNDDIAASHRTLQDSDWQGSSYENAVKIKTELQGQVSSVIEQADLSLQAERKAFKARALALVESVNGEFQDVMKNIDSEYNALATASRKTMENLLAADQTITMGG